MTSEVEGLDLDALEEVVTDRVAPLAYTAGPNTRAAIRDALSPLLAALRAQAEEVERLRAAKWDVKHVDTMNDFVLLGMDRDAERARAEAAERRAGELEGALRPFADAARAAMTSGYPCWNFCWAEDYAAAAALLPATQGENPQEHDDE